jgi:mRNA interferase RelE/StbE
MASYRIEWKKSAIRELRSLPRELVSRIVNAVGELSSNPFPDGVKKLRGAEQTFRIRIGSYRVVYTVTKATTMIEVIRVGHRKNVYER